jgi:hypothetical protein
MERVQYPSPTREFQEPISEVRASGARLLGEGPRPPPSAKKDLHIYR